MFFSWFRSPQLLFGSSNIFLTEIPTFINSLFSYFYQAAIAVHLGSKPSCRFLVFLLKFQNLKNFALDYKTLHDLFSLPPPPTQVPFSYYLSPLSPWLPPSPCFLTTPSSLLSQELCITIPSIWRYMELFSLASCKSLLKRGLIKGKFLIILRKMAFSAWSFSILLHALFSFITLTCSIFITNNLSL